jgi:hypothetical protein
MRRRIVIRKTTSQDGNATAEVQSVVITSDEATVLQTASVKVSSESASSHSSSRASSFTSSYSSSYSSSHSSISKATDD